MTKRETKKLDDIWSLKVRSNGKCEICGKLNKDCQLHPHHFYGRANRSTRWLLKNGICLCASHHALGLWSAHKSPEWFRDEIIKVRGEQWLKDLKKRSVKIWQGTYEQVIKHLEGETKEY